MPERIRTFGYIRVSTREQAIDGYSLAAQTKTIRAYCEAKNYHLVHIYVDAGISGKDVAGRRDFQRMIQDAMSGGCQKIIVWKITRFARNLEDFITTVNQLLSCGVYLESTSEAFDSMTPIGRMMMGILAVVAEWEREVVAENVRAAMQERAEQGKRTCHNVLGYDIDGPDHLVINEQEAEIVRFIFAKYIEYENLSVVAEMCRIAGYNGKRGHPPRPSNIQVILTRPIYCGYNTHNGNTYKGNHEPIISIARYRKVQKLLQKNGKKRQKGEAHEKDI